MLTATDIDLYSLKVDYEQNFKGGKLGFGGKLGIVNTDNDFQRYDVYDWGKVLDTLKSNRFKYEENINALYVNYNKQMKGYLLQFGLRAEQTHSTGTSTGLPKIMGTIWHMIRHLKEITSISFRVHRHLSIRNPKNQWTISFSRRIDRPAYQDLNPFEFKLNEYTFMKGTQN
jgi:hypothetical protein